MSKNFKRVATLVTAVVLSANLMAQFNVSVGYTRNILKNGMSILQKT